MDLIRETFAKCKQNKRAALVAYITAGFPTVDESIEALLNLECGGAGTSHIQHIQLLQLQIISLK